MKFRMMLLATLVGVAWCGTAGAFGLPSMASLTGGLTGGGGGGDPDSFLLKAVASEEMVNKSAEMLFGMVASKEAQAKAEALKVKLSATSNADEKKAIILEKRDSEIAEINRAAHDKDLAAAAKGWDETKKKQGAAALFNLALGAKLAVDLVPEGQNLAKSMQANPMLIMKAGSILSALKSMGGIITGTGKVMIAIPPVFSAAKIDVKLPTSSADKPKAIGDIEG